MYSQKIDTMKWHQTVTYETFEELTNVAKDFIAKFQMSVGFVRISILFLL